MFTGIVKVVGSVRGVGRRNGGLRLKVRYGAAEGFADLAIDESVSVNGVCQTVVALGDGWFEVDTVEETLKKTTLGSLAEGTRVNLERALRPIDRLGGHFVLGHVDCVGSVAEIVDLAGSRRITVGFPPAFDHLVVPVGSIAVDGVSLTVADAAPSRLSVAIIPYTFAHTTIAALEKGSEVNLEFDILGKYVYRQHQAAGAVQGMGGNISDSWLAEHGFG